MKQKTHHPILFSTPMVKAILNGKKTQTRRVIKAPVSDDVGEFLKQLRPCRRIKYEYMGDPEQGHEVSLKPYAFLGDLLYVREAWNIFLNDKGPEHFTRLINFPANNICIDVPEEYWEWYDIKEERGYLGRPSIHLPKWASRIWLKVKDVKVEKLQDISEEDAEKEGVDFLRHYPDADETLTAKELFMCLWDSINGQPRKNGQDISWKANPWVWVVEFERTEKPEVIL